MFFKGDLAQAAVGDSAGAMGDSTGAVGDSIVFFYNRAGVSRFYFGCFQNATGSSSAPRAVPELRIELEATIFHSGGPEIG